MSDETVELDLSGIGLTLGGLPSELAARLCDEWEAFVGAPAAGPFLELRVSSVSRPYAEPEFRPKQMSYSLQDNEARFTMPEGEAQVDRAGRVRIELLEGIGERAYFTLLNLIRASLAWSLPGRGGALLHAAGLELDGRAFVLVGPEGSGKSSWAELGGRGGARVLSDDLILVDGAGPELRVLGTPFRSTHRARYGPGTWPLAGLLFPVQADNHGWKTAEPLLAAARLAANLPFIAEGLERDDRLAPMIRRLTRSVPCAEFRFALDPSFVALLRAWPEQPA